MIWTYLFLKPEKDFKTELSKIMLSSSKWTRMPLNCKRWLKSFKTTSRKLNKIWKKQMFQTKMIAKSMKYCTKRNKKWINSLNNLKKRKKNTKKKSKITNFWLHLCWNICKRLWPNKINSQLKNSSQRWRVTWNSNKDNLKIPKPLQLVSKYRRNPSRWILPK